MLVRRRRELGISQGGLSKLVLEKSGMWLSPGYIAQLETGKIERPGRERLQALEKSLGMPDGVLTEAVPTGLEEVRRIPIIDMAAGPGIIRDYISISREEMEEYGDLVAYRVRGVSMEPEYPDGALVFAEQKAPKIGDVVVAWTQEGGVIKRLEERDGKRVLAGRDGSNIPVDESVILAGVVVRRLF